MRVAYLGPAGTFTHAAALSTPAGATLELVPQGTIQDTILALRDGSAERALVPIENSLEGSVDLTLDTLAFEAEGVRIVGETALPVEQCLIARDPLPPEEIVVVTSHPQAVAQCRQYIRSHLPSARVMSSASTPDAVEWVSRRIHHRWAAIGTRLAAELHGCVVLDAGIEDVSGSESRFVWLAREGAEAGLPGAPVGDASDWKTSIVFSGDGTGSPGWLAGCLTELASRGVNLTRIESRPLRAGLGRYMFFADLYGRDSDPQVSDALDSLRGRVDVLRVLGSFPAGRV